MTSHDLTVTVANHPAGVSAACLLLEALARGEVAEAELTSLVGPIGPSPELMADWHAHFEPTRSRAARATVKRAARRRTEDAEDADG